MYGYIYETTNLINGKKYIGKHACSHFDKEYYGSGSALKKALNKYGKENFKVKILETIDDFEDVIEARRVLSKREQFYIHHDGFDATKDNNYYNVSYGCEDEGWNYDHSGKHNPMYGKTHSKEARTRISQASKDFWTGRHHTKETRKKMSESAKNLWKSRDSEYRKLVGKRTSEMNSKKIILNPKIVFGKTSQKELSFRSHRKCIIKVVDLKLNHTSYYRSKSTFMKYNPEFSTCFFRTKSYFDGIIFNNKQVFNLGFESTLLNTKEFIEIEPKLIKV